MKTAQFHRLSWDYERQTGIGKIIYEPVGIVAFYWKEGIPVKDVNFLNKDEMSFYWQQHKRNHGVALTHGCINERDLQIVAVQEKKYTLPSKQATTSQLALSNNFSFSSPSDEIEGVCYGIEELNLIFKFEGAKRYLATQGGEWLEFDDDTPVVEYKRIESLLGI